MIKQILLCWRYFFFLFHDHLHEFWWGQKKDFFCRKNHNKYFSDGHQIVWKIMYLLKHFTYILVSVLIRRVTFFHQVVELLISKGANFEHRNVSDYTPLSLAASGGYVGIIKLLLSHGAEINSRTGSKLGISPLMLASMNGHTAAVKLLLDMGSDINAQIETNRNTALTLACFQGRHEVVNLLVERKANIEHRAKVTEYSWYLFVESQQRAEACTMVMPE